MTDTRPSILLVEDEAPAVLAFSAVLRDEGFDVYTANDGEAGLALALEKHPTVILTDLKMPKMGGMEMIEKLRADAWGKNAEVFILTNVSDVEMLEKAMTNNAFRYFIKGDTSMAAIVEKIRARLKELKVV